MAKTIRIERGHGLGREAAVRRLGELVSDLERKYGLSVDRKDGSARVQGKGVNGRAEVDDKRILIDLSLGLPASLVASKIEQGIHKAIDEHFTA